MNKAANFALLAVVAVAAMAAERMFVTPQIVEMRPTTKLAGEVISVDAPSTDPKNSGLRKARVKLDTGETVEASVPGGCVVFPGQKTRLAQFGSGWSSVYVVVEDGRNDS